MNGSAGVIRDRSNDEHCFGITELDEIDGLRLNLDELSFRHASSPDTNRISFVESQLIHDLSYRIRSSSRETKRNERRTHCGRLTWPSSAMNSSTPTWVLMSG